MLHKTADVLLSRNPDPIPKYLILRDVLQLDHGNSEMRSAKKALIQCRWIKLLGDSQWEDGTWGRFHTQDTKAKQPIPTTETAIQIALDSGLDGDSPILKKTMRFIVRHIDGKTSWRDWPEKHDNPAAWDVGIPYLSAANLALIDNDNPKIVPFRNTWEKIATAAFASGAYDREAEIKTSNLLMNCERKKPMAFHVRYPLILLSATDKKLDDELQRCILDYAVSSPVGIYYMYAKPLSDVPPVRSKGICGWLRTQLMLSRFPRWHEFAGSWAEDLWAQRDSDGLWEFDPGISRKPYSPFPLSESWRKSGNRKIDCSILVLQLLSRYCRS